MATEVAALVARLEADTRDFQKGIDAAAKRLKKLDKEGKKTQKGLKQTEKATKGLTKSVKQFAVAAGVAFGAREVLNFFKSSITAASDLGESINAVEVVFGDAAEGIKSLGVEAATAVGLSNAEFNSLAVGFAAFVDKIAEGGGTVVGVMEELTGRAADFASVMNIDVAEAATIFRSGLAGETEPLRKFGIDLSAATVSIKALALGLADSTAELTEQDKILARYNLLMEQTDKTAGDFENTSDSLANATRILAATFENAQASIGDALIPTIEKLIPLAQKGIDLIIAWSIWLGRLTGAIDEVDASVRRAKLGIDEEATAIEFLFEAMRKLDLEFGGIDEKAPLGDLFANLITENSLAVELLSSRFDNLAETFGLTAEDAEFMRENAEELAEEFKTTEDAVLGLADRLDKDLVQAARNAASVLGNQVLKRTQEVRDAVLDGLDPALKGLEDQFDDTAEAARVYADELLALADPSFALINTNRTAVEAQKAYNEAVTEFGVSSSEAIGAATVLLEATARYSSAQETYNNQIGPAGEEALRRLAAEAGFYAEDLNAVLEFLDLIGSATRNLPPIPRGVPGFTQFHEGGVVPGAAGTDVAAILQAGETVRTAQQEAAVQAAMGRGIPPGLRGAIGLPDVLQGVMGLPRALDVLRREAVSLTKALRTFRREATRGTQAGAPAGPIVLGGPGGIPLGGVTLGDPGGVPLTAGRGGHPPTTVVVQGFVGSELQLAAQIDKLLTRRSKTSKLGF